MVRLLLIPALALAMVAPEAAAQLAPLAEGGARSVALGRATTAVGGDVWGVANPAAWAALRQSAAAAFVSQAFGMAELRLGAAAVAHPTRFGVAAASGRTYGFDDFRETILALGFGRAIAVSPTREVHAGVALRYTSVTIPDFGSAGAVGLSLGVLVELIPGLDFGALAHNLNRPALSELDPLETRLDAGVSFRAHPRGLVVVAASKDLDFPLSLRGGVEVQPVDVLHLRAGFTTEPTRFSAGIGVAIGNLRADVAGEHHQVLGWTPAFEIGIRF